MNNETWIVDLSQTNSEIWISEMERSSREEAIKAGIRICKKEGLKSFRIGESIPTGVPTLDIDNILEDAYYQVYNEVGECAEGFLDDVTSEQQKELEDKLNEVFYNWVKKYNLEPTCYTIINDKTITIGEAQDE